jgi:DNA invertase Pin-like site-specific DNA recombinase
MAARKHKEPRQRALRLATVHQLAPSAPPPRNRVQADLEAFARERGLSIAAIYTENESGASLVRPELFKLLSDCQPGDIHLPRGA